MFRPIAYLVLKEFRQVVRDRALIRMVIAVPLIQLFVLGYAANTDLENVRVSVLDQDRTRESRRLTDAYHQSDVFTPGPVPEGPSDLNRLLFDGETEVALWIPSGYGADLASGRPAAVSVAVDGSNSSVAGRAAGYAQQIALVEGQRLLEERARARAALGPEVHRVEAVSRFFYNPELESRHYMVPGIVVLIVTVISALLTGVAVVREREIGTLEQLMVSPLTPAQLIAGKTIPFAILAFADLAFATIVAILWFRLPFEGSAALLAGCALVYLLVTLGIGLLASTVSATQQQAMFTLWFFLVFGIIMSGFFFPIENMPAEIRWLTYANPLRYMMSIVRNIFLRGSGVADVGPDLARLGAIGVLTFAAAVLRFQKKIA